MEENRDIIQANKKRNSFTIIKILLFVWFLAGITAFLIAEAVLPGDVDKSGLFCEVFEPQWSQVNEDGTRTPVEIPGHLDVEKGETARIETRIPADLTKYGYLAVKASRQDVNIYVDDELRTSYSNEKTRLFGDTSPPYYVFATFQAKDEGKMLSIEYTTQSAGYSGLVKGMYYGSQAGIWKQLVSRYGLGLFLGILIIVLALVCIVVSLVLKFVYKRRDEKGDLLYLGLGVVLAGFWIVAQSPLRQALWPNIEIASDMTFFTLMLIPLPFLIYVDQVQEQRYHMVYKTLAVISSITSLSSLVLQLTNVMDFHVSVLGLFSVVGIMVATFVATIAIDFKKGRIRPYIQIAIGMIVVSAAGVIQISLYLFYPVNFADKPMCFGFLFLLTMAVIRLLRNAVVSENERLEAIQANKMQEEFLANMSHEIRTPLNAIIGLNEMVLKESGEEAIKTYASDIKGASKTLLGLINDILDFSKIESGKVDLQPVKYWTAFLLTDSYNLILKRAEERNVEVKVEADPAVPEQLFGDEGRIRQIVTNLLTNAVKYTNEGSITLKLHWRKTSIETAMIRISVADTGIGIKPEDQEKLFQSFQRVDEQRNRNIEGTGLGLVISKQLIELMGGRIWVKSTYGEGSEFFIEFPQKIVSERGMGKFTPHASAADEAITQYSTNFTAPEARILVVDDVETNLKVVKNLLKETGYF